MYWAENNLKKLQRANLDGTVVENLVTTGLSAPYGLVLDVAGGKMYWTDRGAGKIQRAHLDGSNVEDLVTTGLSSPLGITLDVAGGKMYWADNGTDKIQRANLDGSNVEDLITTGLAAPIFIALALDGDTPSSTATSTVTPTATPMGPPTSTMTVTPTSTPAVPTATQTPIVTPTPALPDLTVNSMQIELETGSSCNYASTQFGVRVTVHNIGDGDAGLFAVEVNGAQQTVTTGIAKGASQTLWFPGYVMSGNNVVTIDEAQQVIESNEDNNTLSQMVSMPALPPTCTPIAPPPGTQTATATGTPMATRTPTRTPTVTKTPSTPPTSTVGELYLSFVARPPLLETFRWCGARTIVCHRCGQQPLCRRPQRSEYGNWRTLSPKHCTLQPIHPIDANNDGCRAHSGFGYPGRARISRGLWERHILLQQ